MEDYSKNELIRGLRDDDKEEIMNEENQKLESEKKEPEIRFIPNRTERRAYIKNLKKILGLKSKRKKTGGFGKEPEYLKTNKKLMKNED